jgi:Protein of unknown function (DUF3592)
MIEESTWWPHLVMAFIVGVPALVGGALIFVAIRRWTRIRALTASGRQTTARVVDNQWESWSDGQTSFRPVVAFRTESGQEVTTALADLTGFRSHIVGTEIAVVYDPVQPSEATPARRNNGRVVATAVFGVVFLMFALCAYRLAGTLLTEFGEFGSDFGKTIPGAD